MAELYVPLSNSKHVSLTFVKNKDFSFAADRYETPLLLMEVAKASIYVPVVFYPNSELPHALFGLNKENEFIGKNGSWNVPFAPLEFLNYPFKLVLVEKKEGVPVEIIAIDEKAPHFKDPVGDRLFKDDGNPTDFLKKITKAFGAQVQERKKTIALVSEIQKAGVLEQKRAVLNLGSKQLAVEGLLFANKLKVNALPGKTLNQWQKNGAMDLLKAHWDSFKNFKILMHFALDR